mgnify:CR=1 FL=1
MLKEVQRYEEYKVSLFTNGIIQSSALIVKNDKTPKIVYIEGTEFGKLLMTRILDSSYIVKAINKLEDAKEKIHIEEFIIRVKGRDLMASLEILKIGSLTIPRNYLAFTLVLGFSALLILISLIIAFTLAPKVRIT